MKFVKWCIKTIVALMISTVVLSAIAVVYCMTGVHIANKSGATDYVWESNQWKSTMEDGFAWLQMDENGFNNKNGRDEDIDILLMGSSNWEAIHMSDDQNIGALLNIDMPEYNTYNIGMSGHTIYRCMDNIDDACSVYIPDSYVIMETYTMELDEDEMQKIINGQGEEIVSYDSGLIYQVQRIPGVKWIYKQLIDWKNQNTSNDESMTTMQSIQSATYQDTLRKFIHIGKKATEEIGSELVIVYDPSVRVDQNGNMIDPTNTEALECFEAVCKEENVGFINMSQKYEESYEEHHYLKYGYYNTAIAGAHLNKYGCRAIADEIISYIQDEEETNNGIK